MQSLTVRRYHYHYGERTASSDDEDDDLGLDDDPSDEDKLGPKLKYTPAPGMFPRFSTTDQQFIHPHSCVCFCSVLLWPASRLGCDISLICHVLMSGARADLINLAHQVGLFMTGPGHHYE